MRRVLGTTVEGGLLKVTVIRAGETIELTKKEDIGRACHEENRAKFCQTNNTPAMQEPFRL